MSRMISLRPSIAAFFLLQIAAFAAAPPSFQKDIAPILQRRCAACHGEDSAKGGYRLDSFERLGKPGESALPALSPGKPEASELYSLLVESDPNDRMPQKADALPAREIALLETWIRAGALNDSGAPSRPLAELVRDTLLLPAPAAYARPAPVTALAFSPDGTQLAVSGYYEVTLWNVDSGALVRRIGGLPQRITALAWHPTTNRLAVGGGSPSQWGGVFLIDPAADFKVQLLADLPDTALSVAFNPAGNLLAASGGDRSIRLFEVPGGKPLRTLKQHADWVQTLTFSTDGANLVSASRDRTARVAAISSTGDLQTAYDEHGVPVIGAAFSSNGSTVFSVARSQLMRAWDTLSGQTRGEFKDAGRDTQVLLSGRMGLLTGSTNHLVRLNDPNDRRTLMVFFGHRDCVESLAIAPSGHLFASGAHDGEVCLWSLECESPIRRFLATP